MLEMEFQRRGAVHFHLWVCVRESSLSYEEIHDRRVWCSREWFEVAGSGSQAHLCAGTQVKLLVGSDERQHAVNYFKGYLSRKSKAKEYQNRVPDGFSDPGRFWGAIGGFAPEWSDDQPLKPRQFVRVRRLLLKLLQSRNRRRRLRSRSGTSGMFVVGGPSLAAGVGRLVMYYAHESAHPLTDRV